MSDDWRVTVTLTERGHAQRLLAALHEHELERDARQRLGGTVCVSGSDSHVFLYADGEPAARHAQRVMEDLVGQHGFEAVFEIAQWHPVEERWEDPSVPLPTTQEEWEREHERREQDEAAQSESSRHALWEVRIELPSHGDTVALAERLQSEGLSVVRRWKFLLVGANSEDEAKMLAERLENEAPAGSNVYAEASSAMVEQVTAQRPFRLFG